MNSTERAHCQHWEVPQSKGRGDEKIKRKNEATVHSCKYSSPPLTVHSIEPSSQLIKPSLSRQPITVDDGVQEHTTCV